MNRFYFFFLFIFSFFPSFSLNFLNLKEIISKTNKHFVEHGFSEEIKSSLISSSYLKTEEGKDFLFGILNGDCSILQYFEKALLEPIQNTELIRDYSFCIILYFALYNKCILCLKDDLKINRAWSVSEVVMFSFYISKLPFNQMIEIINLFTKDLYSAIMINQPSDLLVAEEVGFLNKLKYIFNTLMQKKWMIPILFFSFIFFSSNLIEK